MPWLKLETWCPPVGFVSTFSRDTETGCYLWGLLFILFVTEMIRLQGQLVIAG